MFSYYVLLHLEVYRGVPINIASTSKDIGSLLLWSSLPKEWQSAHAGDESLQLIGESSKHEEVHAMMSF